MVYHVSIGSHKDVTVSIGEEPMSYFTMYRLGVATSQHGA